LRQIASSKSAICSIVTSAGGKAVTTTSIGNDWLKVRHKVRHSELPPRFEALSDPVTYSQSSTPIVKSLRLELQTLVGGAFLRKMSIEKSVSFLMARTCPAELFSCGR
jgi:hypothetical protein